MFAAGRLSFTGDRKKHVDCTPERDLIASRHTTRRGTIHADRPMSSAALEESRKRDYRVRSDQSTKRPESL